MGFEQEWLDDNRERFKAQTTEVSADRPKERCEHKNIRRIKSNEIRCDCGVGWTLSCLQEADYIWEILQSKKNV